MQREVFTVEAIHGENPESQLMKKEAYYDLTKEAKELLRLIIFSPGELFNWGMEQTTQAKKYHIDNFLRKKRKPVFSGTSRSFTIKERSAIRRDLQEIKEYISLFN